MEKIEKLEKILTYHKECYYNNLPEITDKEYDLLEEELRELDPFNPVLNKVGADPESNKLKHGIWMPSIQKFKKEEDVIDWLENDNKKCCCTFKLDGSSMALYYDNGKFIKAGTRGNGIEGENRTDAFNYIKIPKNIDRLYGMVVWGEVVINKHHFSDLQEEMIKRGLEPVKSIRNSVAGILNRKDNIDLAKYFTFVAHNYFADECNAQHSTKLGILLCHGFKVPKHQFFELTSNNLKDFIEYYQNSIEDYDYLTDGIVITSNDGNYNLENKTNHHYKWNCCLKFESEVAITTIKEIVWKTGRTGKITPILIVEPVELSGCIINRVTAHNAKMILDHHLTSGVTIEITRSNEVIPKFLKVIDFDVERTDYLLIDRCPTCGDTLILSATQTDLICYNDNCPAIIKGTLVNFCKTLEIDGINDSIASRLVDKFQIVNPFNIFRLTKEDLLTVDGFKQTLSEKIFNNIQVCLTNPNITKAKLVESIGIKNIGSTVSVKLQDNGILDNDFNPDDLESVLRSIDGIGETIVWAVIDNFDRIKNILTLAENTIRFDYPFRKVIETNDFPIKKFSGLSFILSGSFSKKKSDIESDIKDLGGTIEKSVNRNLNILVTNETGTSKQKKAIEMKIPIMNEEELYDWMKKEIK